VTGPGLQEPSSDALSGQNVSAGVPKQTASAGEHSCKILGCVRMTHLPNMLSHTHCLALTVSIFTHSQSHTHTHTLSLVLVAVMKSKELKTKISHTHSLIRSQC
jgi:hypothetical protein